MAKKSGSVLMNFGDFVMNVVVRSGGQGDLGGGENQLWWLGWRRVVVESCYGGDGGGESQLEERESGREK